MGFFRTTVLCLPDRLLRVRNNCHYKHDKISKVEFEKLKISFTDKEGKEILVEIPHALLDTQTKLLNADSRTVITRDDFDIDGEKAEFDTVSRTGRFKGRVRASFRNGATFGQPSS